MIINKFEAKNTGKDFLDSGITLAKDDLQRKEIPLQEKPNTETTSDHFQVQKDIESLTKTELKGKYSLTYKSWDNMKQRCKNGKGLLSQEFESFPDFLKNVGARKHKNYTLDRTDNDNPLYSPSTVEWRDKHAQNSNRSSNTILSNNNGESHTIAQWARITGQNKNTLYKRRQQGWTDMEVITGERTHQSTSPFDNTPWPFGRELLWEKMYQKKLAFGGKISRMNFLHDYAKNWLRSLDTDECVNLSIRAENGDLGAIKEIKRIDNQQKRFPKILHETSEQLNYDRKFKSHMNRIEGNKENEQKLFQLVNPRPPYTINKEPVLY